MKNVLTPFVLMLEFSAHSDCYVLNVFGYFSLLKRKKFH